MTNAVATMTAATCAPGDTGCRLLALETATDTAMEILRRAEAAMDAVEDAARAAADYLAADDAAPVIGLKLYITAVALLVFCAVHGRVDRMPWYCVIGCTATSAVLGAGVWEMPATGIPLHAASLFFALCLLRFAAAHG